ncbi:MAG: hypothetical protein ACOYBT_10165 [Polynucleobacter sp.]
MTTETPPPYWEYFLALESDLEKCSRYVEFSLNNYKTHSIEFARIIMAASSEFDTIAKEICDFLGNKKASGINEYAETIITQYPCFYDYEIAIPRYNIAGVAPFGTWRTSPKITPIKGNKTKKEYSNPTWWTDYNDIKHDRTSNFKSANLENAIHSMGGLLTGLIYLYGLKYPDKLDMEMSFKPKLLSPQKPSSSDDFQNGGIFYCIDNPTTK